MAGIAFDSCTGRAIPVGDDLPASASATIGIATPIRLASPGPALAALSARGLRIVISPGLDDIVRYSLIKTGIVPVILAIETVAELRDAVGSDPGILLTVDIRRGDVRARKGPVARIDFGDAEGMARRLLFAQRLLCSRGLADEDRIRLQRRLVAIGNVLKVPRADAERGAWRLDLLLADIAGAADPRPPAGTS